MELLLNQKNGRGDEIETGVGEGEEAENEGIREGGEEEVRILKELHASSGFNDRDVEISFVCEQS